MKKKYGTHGQDKTIENRSRSGRNDELAYHDFK